VGQSRPPVTSLILTPADYDHNEGWTATWVTAEGVIANKLFCERVHKDRPEKLAKYLARQYMVKLGEPTLCGNALVYPVERS
jgi:hypothetical protein